MRFAQQQGFQIERHTFESTLDVASFDESRFAGQVESVEAAGIRFFTLADLGNTEEAQRQLYTLNERLNRDVPGYQSWLPFEEFQTQVSARAGPLSHGVGADLTFPRRDLPVSPASVLAHWSERPV